MGRFAGNGNRVRTTTSAFGAGRREAHDSSPFYDRFAAPELSSDGEVASTDIDGLFVQEDSRQMSLIPDASVALVVTSPPYFAGKEYETSLGENGVPATYLEYLTLLKEVFSECVRKLEPGGRIAVNVANLGRKPYRSLAADVIGILQDDLGLLLRGEIVWLKARGQSGSCAWGSYLSSANPTLRDLTERIVVASKGRFDRSIDRTGRAERGLPNEDSITADEFMEATLDVWEIPAESARKVGHPAPFPVELPRRAIELFTYRQDLVLDPFMGSGSTAVAAAMTGRRVAGYDTDAGYLALAEKRYREAINAGTTLPAGRLSPNGTTAKATAVALVEQAGFEITGTDRKVAGVPVSILATDAGGQLWLFDVTGSFAGRPRGLAVAETLWQSLGKAAVLRDAGHRRLVLLTSHLPPEAGELGRALHSGRGVLFADAIGLLEEAGPRRLSALAQVTCA
ncbi:MAG: DNA-methyltransferase [Actinomycetota bacterium]